MKFTIAGSVVLMAVLAVVLAQDEATDTTQSTEETTLTPSGIFPEPSDEEKCVLQTTIKLLQDDLAHTTSCESLEENLKAAKECPVGVASVELIRDVTDTFNFFCSSATGSSSTDESTTPTPSPVEK